MAKYLLVLAIVVGAFALAVRYETLELKPTLPPPPEKKATILFGGDMQFDRAVRTSAAVHTPDYLFSCIDDTLQSVDLAIANLEGPITDNASISEGSAVGSAPNFTFTFPTTTATLLKTHHIGLVNIGNNHIMNFGRTGLLQTEYYLDGAGVLHLGDPDKAEADRVVRVTLKGIPVSFVNWSDWTSDKTDHTVAQVAAEKSQGRVVLVYTHWGEEYVPPPSRVKALARSFIDAGAALVVGSHPHIVQEKEEYNGAYIYYSLGNFIFDQHFNDAVDHGLLLRVTIGEEGVTHIDELPIAIDSDSRPCLQ